MVLSTLINRTWMGKEFCLKNKWNSLSMHVLLQEKNKD